MDKINMPEVWGNYTTGGNTILNQEIVVAVIDNSFDLDHEDLNFKTFPKEVANPIDGNDNDHTDNTYDFMVTRDFSIGTFLSGISGYQGNSSLSAGNTFTKNSSPTGSDFYNDTYNYVTYYYDNGTDKKPLNVYYVGVPTNPSFSARGCPSGQSMMMASSSSNEQQFYDNQTAYQTALKTYQENIDGGQTEALINDLELADSRSTQTIYEDLIERSPWLSAAVLEKLLDQAHLFTFEQVNNLLLANPDLRKESLLWERLSNQLGTQQIENLKTAMASQATNERTELEETLAYHFTEMQIASSALIRHALTQESTDLSAARNWLSKKETLKANYAIVESWLQEKQADKALAVLNQIASKVTLEPHQALGYLNYQALTQLKVNAMNSGRTIADFTKEEVLDLVEIADRSRGRAGVQARGILNFFYGYEYVNSPRTKTATDASGSAGATLLNFKVDQPVNTLDQSLISVSPNPANDVITFRYNLQGYPDARIMLNIFDESGRNIKAIVLDPMAGQMEWNTSQLESGLYLYQLTTTAKTISSGQFLIAR